MEEVANALHVTLDAIKNFDEEAAINVISNTFTSQDSSTLNAINYYPTFNPVDKIVELYERMLKDKNEMIEKLEGLLKNK